MTLTQPQNISPYLAGEIVSRYYHQKGEIITRSATTRPSTTAVTAHHTSLQLYNSPVISIPANTMTLQELTKKSFPHLARSPQESPRQPHRIISVYNLAGSAPDMMLGALPAAKLHCCRG
ncbi:hypothetical protein [Duncaniella freteri]|uniref:hypothetical protein n=1 Tax=Duncaniella freteri TaxID=2530391 RepID=UPI003F66EA5F